MKNWRRGTQDYEYLYLADLRGLRVQADAIVDGLIPQVLSDAAGLSEKSWPSRSIYWENACHALADLIVGVSVEPDIALSSDSLNFENVNIGNSFRKTFTISNEGTGSLNVTSVTSNAAEFKVVSPTFPQTILPGTALHLIVQFTPSVQGPLTGNLTIESNDPDESELAVKLIGKSGAAEDAFPDWAYEARIAGVFFLPDYTDADIEAELSNLAARGTSVALCDCPLGWSYSAWVDDDEFADNIVLIQRVVAAGHALGLKIVWYLTGLEVTSEDERNPGDEHRDWLQIAIDGSPIAFNDINNEDEHWLDEGQWDAWFSPSGAYRDFFLNREEIFSWIEQHKDYIYMSHSTAKVAVLYSARTRDILDQGWGDFYSL